MQLPQRSVLTFATSRTNMLQIENFNPFYFSEVETMLKAKFGNQQGMDGTIVVLGSNDSNITPEQWRQQHPGSRLVVFNLEQLYKGSPWLTNKVLAWLKGADEIWDYDVENINFLYAIGIRASYVPMEYTEELKYTSVYNGPKDIDVLFYGAPTDRRLKILQSWMGMSQKHAVTMVATGISGKLLEHYIHRSKIILNLHAFEGSYRQEQVRIFVPVINGCCVVSENSSRNEFSTAIVESSTKGMNATLKNLLKSGDWEKVGKNAPETYKIHCSNRFRSGLR